MTLFSYKRNYYIHFHFRLLVGTLHLGVFNRIWLGGKQGGKEGCHTTTRYTRVLNCSCICCLQNELCQQRVALTRVIFILKPQAGGPLPVLVTLQRKGARGDRDHVGTNHIITVSKICFALKILLDVYVFKDSSFKGFIVKCTEATV